MNQTSSPWSSPESQRDGLALLRGLVQIPSPSGHEAEAVGYLVDWMAGHGFIAYRDQAGNAIGVLEAGSSKLEEASFQLPASSFQPPAPSFQLPASSLQSPASSSSSATSTPCPASRRSRCAMESSTAAARWI